MEVSQSEIKEQFRIWDCWYVLPRVSSSLCYPLSPGQARPLTCESGRSTASSTSGSTVDTETEAFWGQNEPSHAVKEKAYWSDMMKNWSCGVPIDFRVIFTGHWNYSPSSHRWDPRIFRNRQQNYRWLTECVKRRSQVPWRSAVGHQRPLLSGWFDCPRKRRCLFWMKIRYEEGEVNGLHRPFWSTFDLGIIYIIILYMYIFFGLFSISFATLIQHVYTSTCTSRGIASPEATYRWIEEATESSLPPQAAKAVENLGLLQLWGTPQTNPCTTNSIMEIIFTIFMYSYDLRTYMMICMTTPWYDNLIYVSIWLYLHSHT